MPDVPAAAVSVRSARRRHAAPTAQGRADARGAQERPSLREEGDVRRWSWARGSIAEARAAR